MSVAKDLANWLDSASDAVEEAINLRQEVAEKQRVEHWTEDGRQAGEARAEADYASGNWQMNPVNEVETPNDPGVAPGSTFDAVELPSFVNPVMTAVEVAFTPSELNVGEFAQRDAFQAGESDGYRTGMFTAFDQALEDRFAPPPLDPAPDTPSILDCLVPPLDAPPTTDWSACGPEFSNTELGSGSSSWSEPDSGSGSYDSGGSGGGSDSGSSD